MFVYSAKKVRIKRVKILFKSKYTVSTDITTKILKEGELERQNTKKKIHHARKQELHPLNRYI